MRREGELFSIGGTRVWLARGSLVCGGGARDRAYVARAAEIGRSEGSGRAGEAVPELESHCAPRPLPSRSRRSGSSLELCHQICRAPRGPAGRDKGATVQAGVSAEATGGLQARAGAPMNSCSSRGCLLAENQRSSEGDQGRTKEEETHQSPNDVAGVRNVRQVPRVRAEARVAVQPVQEDAHSLGLLGNAESITEEGSVGRLRLGAAPRPQSRLPAQLRASTTPRNAPWAARESSGRESGGRFLCPF